LWQFNPKLGEKKKQRVCVYSTVLNRLIKEKEERMKSPFGYLGTHGFFLLFCAGIIIVIVFFSLSSLQLAADGDAMLGMFRLKFHLINSAPLHGSHVVCELLSTNCLPDNCACVFDFELQLICCGKEFGVCRFSL